MGGVVVVGSGPTGLVLAGELALAGVDVTVLERRATPELAGSRAGGFHARVLEILDLRGLADRFLAEGTTAQVVGLGRTVVGMEGMPTRHPYTLGLWQNHIERILRAWVDELGVRVRYGAEVAGVEQDATGVDLRMADAETVRASYVVGADGGRSVVRRTVGVAFPGWEATRSHLIAEVEVTDPIEAGVRRDDTGIHGLQVMADGHTVRAMVTERELASGEATLDDLRRELTRVYGRDFGAHDPAWLSRFTDATRQADAYRVGRVLLAGDAAHVHHPAGGQGIGLGVQDAVNLGWKLAQVVAGHAPESLLDSYHAERHPATARALRFTMAQSVLQRPDPRVEALDGVVGELLEDGPARERVAALMSGLDVSYDLGPGHPLLGRRVPDLDLVTPDGVARVSALLHAARPVLLDLGRPGPDLPGWAGWAGWADRVRLVRASYDGEWRLPVLGVVPAPTAVLVRPDGHVAWVGEGSDAGLVEALTTWCGGRG